MLHPLYMSNQRQRFNPLSSIIILLTMLLLSSTLIQPYDYESIKHLHKYLNLHCVFFNQRHSTYLFSIFLGTNLFKYFRQNIVFWFTESVGRLHTVGRLVRQLCSGQTIAVPNTAVVLGSGLLWVRITLMLQQLLDLMAIFIFTV